MFRHMQKKILFDDEEIRDTNAHESGNVIDFAAQEGGSHAPTDLTYLVDNDLDQQVSVQIVGGEYDSVAGTWTDKHNIGNPTVIAADSKDVIDVFPGNLYVPAYDVEVTAAVNPTVDGITVRAHWVKDQ